MMNGISYTGKGNDNSTGVEIINSTSSGSSGTADVIWFCIMISVVELLLQGKHYLQNCLISCIYSFSKCIYKFRCTYELRYSTNKSGHFMQSVLCRKCISVLNGHIDFNAHMIFLPESVVQYLKIS